MIFRRVDFCPLSCMLGLDQSICGLAFLSHGNPRIASSEASFITLNFRYLRCPSIPNPNFRVSWYTHPLLWIIDVLSTNNKWYDSFFKKVGCWILSTNSEDIYTPVASESIRTLAGVAWINIHTQNLSPVSMTAICWMRPLPGFKLGVTDSLAQRPSSFLTPLKALAGRALQSTSFCTTHFLGIFFFLVLVRYTTYRACQPCPWGVRECEPFPWWHSPRLRSNGSP